MADCANCETEHRRTLVISLVAGLAAGGLITFLFIRRAL